MLSATYTRPLAATSMSCTWLKTSPIGHSVIVVAASAGLQGSGSGTSCGFSRSLRKPAVNFSGSALRSADERRDP